MISKKNFLKILLILFIFWLFKPFTILILGSDARIGQSIKGSRTDGIVLIKVTPLLARAKIVSIPRDTYSYIPCKKINDKITHAHAFGGVKCSVKSVEKLMGTKVNNYILFRFDDVINISSKIDGVNITSNGTFSQDGHFFEKGKKYNLKGEAALAYTRHRKSDGGMKRDERQRQVIMSITKKLIKPSGWQYIPSVVNYTYENMNIKINILKTIASFPVLLNPYAFKIYKLEGENSKKKGVYYFIPDKKSLKTLKYKFKVFI